MITRSVYVRAITEYGMEVPEKIIHGASRWHSHPASEYLPRRLATRISKRHPWPRAHSGIHHRTQRPARQTNQTSLDRRADEESVAHAHKCGLNEEGNSVFATARMDLGTVVPSGNTNACRHLREGSGTVRRTDAEAAARAQGRGLVGPGRPCQTGRSFSYAR